MKGTRGEGRGGGSDEGNWGRKKGEEAVMRGQGEKEEGGGSDEKTRREGRGGGSDEGNKGRQKGEEAVMKGTRGERRGRRQ